MEVILLIFLFAIGACVGSFLNVVIWRLPRGESIVFPGSHCPRCGRAIAWYDNIPLLSWLALRAKCRHCKAPISPRYLVVEAVTAVLVAGLFLWLYIARLRSGAGDIRDTWPTFLALAAGAGLSAAIIDPTEPDMMATILAAACLTGQDDYCMKYITAQRQGRL